VTSIMRTLSDHII